MTVPEARGDEATAFLMGEGAGGLVEELVGHRVQLVTYGEERALRRLERAVSTALGTAARTRVRPAPASLTGWETAWMEDLAPVAISRTLMLATAGATVPEGNRATVVRLEPALAFGFGEHPTTRLAARAVERQCRTGGVKTLLDVGTGSGVLGLVGAVSGARRVLGIDVDASAVAAAKRNAASNGLDRICRFNATRLARLRATFDLVVANVDRGTLLSESAHVCRVVAPRGTLLLTGFLASDLRDIEERYVALGLERAGRKREGDWVLATFRQP